MQNVEDKSNVPQSDSIDVVHLVSKRSSSISDATVVATDSDDNLDDLIDDADDDLHGAASSSDAGVHWIVRGVNRIKRSLGLQSGETTKIKSKRKRNHPEGAELSSDPKVKPKKSSKAKEKLSGKKNKTVPVTPRPKREE